ncbi:MAG: nicotinate (nicotinamide) nucleotide adenylyltransferase [Planctomycetota bacterium]|nr:MAG: nicotinate (nicotinamide) nucleotide adenylyltransferase [Planctomycetota bacterium]
MKIAVFGGSFDPVHRGHLAAADAVAARLQPDRFFWVPARRSPHKPGQAPAEDSARLSLLRSALASRPREELCTLELERPGPSYTVDTLEELQRQYPEAELWLVLGADALKNLPTWHEFPRLLALARLAVVPRDRHGVEALDALRRRLPGELAPRMRARFVAMTPVAASSTGIRERLQRGEACGDLLPPEVEQEVRRLGLYCSAT